MKKIRLVMLVLPLFLVSPLAKAAFSPIALDLIAPVQLPPEDFTITGLRLSVLYGEHRNMYGIDIGGIGNMTDLDFGGIAVSGIFNMTKGTTNILLLQGAAAANINYQKTKVLGVQLAAINSNMAETYIVGFELGPLANLGPHTTIYGFGIGIYNKAYEVYGFQIGVINSVTNLHGLQIGLLNFNDKGIFPVCPILNVGF